MTSQDSHNPQDQTQAETLARKFANCKNELCATCPANAKLIDSYAIQRALELLGELLAYQIQIPAGGSKYVPADFIEAKRLNLTKEIE